MRPSCRAFWLKKKNKLPSPVKSFSLIESCSVRLSRKRFKNDLSPNERVISSCQLQVLNKKHTLVRTGT